MSDNATLAAMRRMGVTKDEMSAHGWRAVAQTLLDEELGFPPHLIEHQLAHAVRVPWGAATTARRTYTKRVEMMQAWADYLDKLKAGGEVVLFEVRA